MVRGGADHTVHCEIFLVQFAPRCTSRFRQVQRGARGAVAVHATARDRNGAPGSALHFKRTERSLVSSVAFAALVYSGLVARSPKSCTCASTELVAYLQITTTAHACRPGCTRVVTQGHPLLHSAPSIRLSWQDIFSSVTFRAVSSLSCKVRRVELGILGRQQVRFGAIYHITDYDTSAAALGAF